MSELIKLSYHKNPDKRQLQKQNDITGVAEYADLHRFEELIQSGYEISSSRAPQDAKPGLIGVTKTFKFHNGRKEQKLEYLLHNRDGKLVIDDFKPFEIRGMKVSLVHDKQKGDLLELEHDHINYHPYDRKETNNFVFAYRKVQYFNDSMLAAIQDPHKNMASTNLNRNEDAENHNNQQQQQSQFNKQNDRNKNRFNRPLGQQH